MNILPVETHSKSPCGPNYEWQSIRENFFINHNFNNAHNEETDEYVKPSFQLIEGEGLNDENEINDLDPEDSVSVFLRIDYLESEVAILTHELMALRAEVDAMRDPSA